MLSKHSLFWKYTNILWSIIKAVFQKISKNPNICQNLFMIKFCKKSLKHNFVNDFFFVKVIFFLSNLFKIRLIFFSNERIYFLKWKQNYFHFFRNSSGRNSAKTFSCSKNLYVFSSYSFQFVHFWHLWCHPGPLSNRTGLMK